MKKLLAGVSAFAICSSAWAATYSYDNPSSPAVLTVTLAEGETLAFDNAVRDAQWKPTLTKLVQTGAGTLDMTADLSAYVFDVAVESGGCFNLKSDGGFGRSGSSDHTRIDVADGATVRFMNSDQTAHRYRDYHVAGKGVYSEADKLYLGSINIGAASGIKYNAITYRITLEGDTEIRFAGSHYIANTTIDVNGHDVRFRTTGNPFLAETTVLTDTSAAKTGTLTVDASYGWVSHFKNFHTVGAASNRIVVKGGYVFEIYNLFPDYEQQWTLDLSDGGVLCGNDGAKVWTDNMHNNWRGPVTLGNSKFAKICNRSSADGGVALSGKVTGEGGFWINGPETGGTSWISPRLNPQLYLMNPENDFTMGVIGQYGTLHICANGAVPAAGGPVALTNSVCNFHTDEVLSLPSAEFCATETSATHSNAVHGGTGKWNGYLRKTGSEELVYRSSIGSDLLDVQAGSFRVDTAPQQRAAVAGLIEGTWSHEMTKYNMMCAILGSGTTRANPSLPLGTNAVVSCPRLLYIRSQATDEWGPSKCYSYSGYVWNDSPTNEVWSFAGISDTGNYEFDWRVDIDGQLVIGRCQWDVNTYFSFGGNAQDVSTNTVTLTPGPHRFEYRSASASTITNPGPQTDGYWINNGGNYRSSYEGPNKESWDTASGIMFNRTGKCTRIISDYQKFEDPGDGSLLTWDIPSNDGNVHPVTGETVDARPVFGAAKFVAGAEADFGDSTYRVAQMTGWPTIRNGGLEVTDSWTFDGAQVGASTFSISGALTFGASAEAIFGENGKPASEFRNKWVTLGVAEGGITGELTTSSPRWAVAVDADGKTLKARYTSPGAIILFR